MADLTKHEWKMLKMLRRKGVIAYSEPVDSVFRNLRPYAGGHYTGIDREGIPISDGWCITIEGERLLDSRKHEVRFTRAHELREWLALIFSIAAILIAILALLSEAGSQPIRQWLSGLL